MKGGFKPTILFTIYMSFIVISCFYLCQVMVSFECLTALPTTCGTRRVGRWPLHTLDQPSLATATCTFIIAESTSSMFRSEYLFNTRQNQKIIRPTKPFFPQLR